MYMFWANGNKNTRWGFNTFGFYFFTHERGHQHFGCSHKECCFYTSKSDFFNTGNISTHIPHDPQVSPTISATWLNVKSTNGGCVLDPSVWWSWGVMLSCCSNFDPWRVLFEYIGWVYPPIPLKMSPPGGGDILSRESKPKPWCMTLQQGWGGGR